jgi:hypothetical protein
MVKLIQAKPCAETVSVPMLSEAIVEANFLERDLWIIGPRFYFESSSKVLFNSQIPAIPLLENRGIQDFELLFCLFQDGKVGICGFP